MNSFRTSLLVIAATAALLLCLQLRAQAATPESGLIGKRHAGLDFTYDHFQSSRVDKALGLAGALNVPVSSELDFNVSYAYADASGASYDALDKTLGLSLLVHQPTEYGRGYFAGTLGHSWHRLDTSLSGIRDNGAFWGVRAGYEIPFRNGAAINAGLAYTDAFDHSLHRNRQLRYFAEASRWLTRDLAGVVSASYRQIKDAPDAVTFTIGMRVAF